jgi:hypothetical protein
MKKNVPIYVTLILVFAYASFSACSHKYYTDTLFEQQTAGHRIVAVLPAEMIFTGNQPKDLAPEQIAKIEEMESKSFQQSLYNGILRYANSKNYTTTVNLQDVNSTEKLLEQNNISIKDSWKKDDKELTQLLGVDAVVRMRIQKQRYMSDVASYGISVGRQIIFNTGLGSKIPVPYINNSTNDIYASCNLVSKNITLWNDSYKEASNWNSPSNVIIENITDNFGRHFPYKRRR